MAEMTIRLRINPETGKKDIVVSLRSDDDSLPHEHEQQHKELVDKLIEGGLLTEGEAGGVVIEREEEKSGDGETTQKREQSDQAQSLSEGQ